MKTQTKELTAKPISHKTIGIGLYTVTFDNGEQVLVDFTLPEFKEQRNRQAIFQQAISNYEAPEKTELTAKEIRENMTSGEWSITHDSSFFAEISAAKKKYKLRVCAIQAMEGLSGIGLAPICEAEHNAEAITRAVNNTWLAETPINPEAIPELVKTLQWVRDYLKSIPKHIAELGDISSIDKINSTLEKAIIK